MNLAEEASRGKKGNLFLQLSFMEFKELASHPREVVTRPYIGSFVKNTFNLLQPRPRKDKDFRRYNESLSRRTSSLKKIKNRGFKKS